MSIPAYALAYLQRPFTVCEPAVAAALARAGWATLAQRAIYDTEQYSAAACWLGSETGTTSKLLLTEDKHAAIFLEHPEFQCLQAFYDEHGLEPLTEPELVSSRAIAKVRQALTLLTEVKPVAACIREVVRTIQVLRQPDAEIDLSYSHPKIPFSIFVSVCEDFSAVSTLRVAESILHEAMHLQLTLLEGEVTLVQPASPALYYSPWRDEDRPIQGVLHGLFVFRAVHDFYVVLSRQHSHSREVRDFLSDRIASIESEFSTLRYFNQVPELTEAGKLLVVSLLEY